MRFTDAVGHTLYLNDKPVRIVSLVPSQSELLCDLGLTSNIVGVTRFCVHPENLRKESNVVGGTKDFRLTDIEALEPDLVLCNKEENTEKLVKEMQQKFPTYTTDVYDLDSALEMIDTVGLLTRTENKAQKLQWEIKSEFESLPLNEDKQRAAYLIWKDPYMTVNQSTFIHQMMARAGFINVIDDPAPYPSTSTDQLKELNPDIILLSSEPYPFSDKHIDELTTLTGIQNIVLVDGEMFSWYGSRLLHFPTYYQKLRKQLGLNNLSD